MDDSKFVSKCRDLIIKRYTYKEKMMVSKSASEIKKIVDEYTEREKDEIQLKTDTGFVQNDQDYFKKWIRISYRRKRIKDFENSFSLVHKEGSSCAVCLKFEQIDEGNTEMSFYYDKITVKIFELTVMLIAIFFGCYIITKDLAFTDNVNIETIVGFIVMA